MTPRRSRSPSASSRTMRTRSWLTALEADTDGDGHLSAWSPAFRKVFLDPAAAATTARPGDRDGRGRSTTRTPRACPSRSCRRATRRDDAGRAGRRERRLVLRRARRVPLRRHGRGRRRARRVRAAPPGAVRRHHVVLTPRCRSCSRSSAPPPEPARPTSTTARSSAASSRRHRALHRQPEARQHRRRRGLSRRDERVRALAVVARVLDLPPPPPRHAAAAAAAPTTATATARGAAGAGKGRAHVKISHTQERDPKADEAAVRIPSSRSRTRSPGEPHGLPDVQLLRAELLRLRRALPRPGHLDRLHSSSTAPLYALACSSSTRSHPVHVLVPVLPAAPPAQPRLGRRAARRCATARSTRRTLTTETRQLVCAMKPARSRTDIPRPSTRTRAPRL